MADSAPEAVGAGNSSNFDTFTKLVHALNEANAEATQLERQIEAKAEEQRLLSAEVQRLKQSSSWLFSWGTNLQDNGDEDHDGADDDEDDDDDDDDDGGGDAV